MEIFETTLRDGEQQAFLHLSPGQKAELAVLLEQLGVNVIDAGFPAASNVDQEGVRRIAAQTRDVKLSVLSRPIKKDIRRAYDLVEGAEHRSRIATSARPFDLLSEDPTVSDYQRTIDRSCDLMAEVRGLFPEAQYYLICAGNRDPSFVVQLSAAVAQAGATHVVIADTLSTMEPQSLTRLVRKVRRALPAETTLGIHCHNLLGLSLANSIAGVKTGATQVEVTIGNTGDGGGNAALEQVLAYAAFFERHDPRFSNSCKTEAVAKVVQRFRDFTGMTFSPNKALIGEISFLVETGIHQAIPDTILRDVFRPETVGRQVETVIGRHSGIAGIVKQLNRMNLPHETVNRGLLYREVMKAAEKSGFVADGELRKIASSLMATTVGPDP